MLLADLIVFDQSAYWINATHPELKNPNLPADGSAGTSDKAYAFIPPACRKGAGGKPCRMHLYHHGCVSHVAVGSRQRSSEQPHLPICRVAY